MTLSEKPEKVTKKHRNLLPDRQLADAFSFTSEDLAVNRLGFMTEAQRWRVPMLWRPLAQMIFHTLPTRQRRQIDTVCGKLTVTMQYGLDYRGFRRHFHVVNFGGGNSLTFDLNSTQHTLLARQQGLIYRAYYVCFNAYKCRLLSLERLTDGC